MTSPILDFQALQVRAGPHTLLDVPWFRLDAGELLSLVGPNGSGKTTFLHTAALLRLADAGQVIFAGMAVNKRNAESLRRRISIVFQDPLLFSVDVLRNVSVGLHFHGVPREEARRRAMECLALFGVAHLAHRKPHGLSGGEAARVALARAFVTCPDLLLLDEPFSALDARTREVLLPELRERLMERGAAAVLVTHDISEAFAFAPRLVLLDGGKMIADGNVRVLTMRPPSPRAAALLGAENVLGGRVVTQARGFWNVEVTPGVCLLAVHDQALLPGTQVQVTIPATTIRLLPATSAVSAEWNAIQARVESVTSHPGWDVISMSAAGIQLRVREGWSAGGSRWAAGDALTASFPPDAAWIIPEAKAG